MFDKRKANKKLQKLLNAWYENGKKGSPSKAVGMTHQEFQDWIWNDKLPERFLT